MPTNKSSRGKPQKQLLEPVKIHVTKPVENFINRPSSLAALKQILAPTHLQAKNITSLRQQKQDMLA